MRQHVRLMTTCLLVTLAWSAGARAQDVAVEQTSSTSGPTSAGHANRPQLDPDESIVCMKFSDGTTRRVQCDEAAKRCLVADPHLEIPGARDKVVARMIKPCRGTEKGALGRLEADGYEMVPARLESRYGYKRDERGRIYQTHFDLRRRFLLGLYDQMRVPTGDSRFGHRLSAEIGGIYEDYSRGARRRDRHRFLSGRLTLAPLEAHGVAYAYDRGRSGDQPAFRFVEFVTPEPDRYDLSIHLGPGFRVGRFNYEQSAGRDQLLVDVGQAHLNWELIQTDAQGLEDYVLIRAGGGGGRASVEGWEDDHLYVYPEVGLEAAWLMGDRGLTEFRLHAAYRHIWDDADYQWNRARANVSLERVVLSINDQPLTVFAQGGFRYNQGPITGGGQTTFRALVGGRVNFFVPTRPNYGEGE